MTVSGCKVFLGVRAVRFLEGEVGFFFFFK